MGVRTTDVRRRLGISADDWGDWRWHMRNRLRTAEDLASWISLAPEEEEGIEAVAGRYDWFVTPYYASLMDPDDPSCPIRLQALPSVAEMTTAAGDDPDPVGDMSYRATNRVIHKYHDRVVLLVTSQCPVLCRFCTRKFHTTAYDGTYFEVGEAVGFDEDLEYIRAHPEIRDVLLTGGDPLTYSDSRLERIIAPLREIEHVEVVRIGTRYPVLLPQRITPELCTMLDRYQPIWLNTHFNHPTELTSDSRGACERLLRAGVPVGNQSVLLRGVNDETAVMTELVRALIQARVRPYYLYQCDNVEGVSHFQTTIESGRAIMRDLVGHTTGFAVPSYIVTTKAGKIPLSEDNILSVDDSAIVLRSHTGEVVTIPVPGVRPAAP
jgi:lysine 2,3-aminomutase